MIDGLKPYPAYKPSGVEWLGEVPEHWEVRPFGAMGSLFKGNGGNKGDEVPAGIPCIRYGDLYTRHEFFITKSKAYVSKDRAAAYTPIRYGDVLFAASGETEEDIGRSSVNLIEGEARCGGDVLVLRPEVPALPRYLGYAADSPASRRQKACMGRGFTVVHIYGSQLKRLVVPLPPLPEQAAIVRFLDHADRRIRRHIRAKQKLVKLLEELKGAIFHRAVTGQIDVRSGQPYPRYKPSGVPWLGEVPEHWDVRRGKWLFRSVKELNSDLQNTNVLSLTLRGVVNNDPDDPEGLVPKDYGTYQLFARGDLVFKLIDLENFRTSRVGLVHESGIMSPAYVRLVHAHSGSQRYFFQQYFDLYQRGVFNQLGAGVRSTLSARDLLEVPVLCPTAVEQAAIVRFLDQATSAIVHAIERANREISLLREYRTRLIADVVTGKLDVREAALRLPEVADEPEPLDEADAAADSDEEAAGAADIEAADAEA